MHKIAQKPYKTAQITAQLQLVCRSKLGRNSANLHYILLFTKCNINLTGLSLFPVKKYSSSKPLLCFFPPFWEANILIPG